MKLRAVLFVVGLSGTWTLSGGVIGAQTAAPEEGVFSTKGKITEVVPEEKTVRLKNEGGLELTFQVVATTEIKEDEGLKLFENLVPGDTVEIRYTYNEDYEKVASLIRKEAVKKQAEARPNPVSS